MSHGADPGGHTHSVEISPVERSRRLILAEIGAPPDLTLIQTGHEPHDQLAAAGVRELLAAMQYREVDLDELPGERGHTALIAFGGGLCRPRHDPLSRVLAVASLRFERVIALPAWVDPSEDVVQEALTRARATVFASDATSFEQIVPFCRARLAHDCAFFFDYAPYIVLGHGVLNVFRDDRLGVDDLRGWLEAIAAYELVRTDRREVMIAAALLGKSVEYEPDLEGNLDALVKFALQGRPVSAIRTGTRVADHPRPAALSAETEQAMHQLKDAGLPLPAPMHRDSAGPPRVTVVVASRNRPELAARALDSVRASSVPLEIIVVDNASEPVAAQMLQAICRDRDPVQFHRQPHNLHAGGGRQLGAELAGTELVLFLDDDAELLPGALEWMLADLDSHPEIVAVTATVVDRYGRVMHSGGTISVTAQVADFRLTGQGQALLDLHLPPSGPTDWVATTALLVRQPLLLAFPMDEKVSAYFEDNEWAYRIASERPGSFWRSREALALHQSRYKPVVERTFEGRSLAVEWLAALGRFYERHGLLLSPWTFSLVPELMAEDRSADLAGAQLLMDLVSEKGTDWVFSAWMNGELAGLLAVNRYR